MPRPTKVKLKRAKTDHIRGHLQSVAHFVGQPDTDHILHARIEAAVYELDNETLQQTSVELCGILGLDHLYATFIETVRPRALNQEAPQFQ